MLKYIFHKTAAINTRTRNHCVCGLIHMSTGWQWTDFRFFKAQQVALAIVFLILRPFSEKEWQDYWFIIASVNFCDLSVAKPFTLKFMCFHLIWKILTICLPLSHRLTRKDIGIWMGSNYSHILKYNLGILLKERLSNDLFFT